MNNQRLGTVQQITGQVRSLFYLVDEPAAMFTIQADDQVTPDLRALPRSATICATLHDAPPHDPQIVAFTIVPA